MPLPLEDDVLVRAVRVAVVDHDEVLQSTHAGVAEVGVDVLLAAAVLLPLTLKCFSWAPRAGCRRLRRWACGSWCST